MIICENMEKKSTAINKEMFLSTLFYLVHACNSSFLKTSFITVRDVSSSIVAGML